MTFELRNSLTVPKDSTLHSLQSSLRASIELRLDPGRQLLAEEENAKAAKRREKEREKEKRAQRKKRREEKKRKEAEKETEKSASISTDSGNVADIISETQNLNLDENVEENIEDIFAPKECLEDLDPHDRDVEIFKKFCLGRYDLILMIGNY